MLKKYLPSKQFIYSFITIIIVGLIIFGISSYFSRKNHYASPDSNKGLETGKLTLNNLLQKDTDGDGVMDWEEALWGTDPKNKATFDGTPDAEYIKKRKDALNINDSSDGTDAKNLTETDKFSQEFFASMVAMKQSGQVDQNTIKNVSSALGQRIGDPTIPDQYTNKDLKLSKTDNKNTKVKYYSDLKTLFDKYKTSGLGDELSIVSTISSSPNNELDVNTAIKLNSIANAYQDFAQKALNISVPSSLASNQLEIVNSANNTGLAVKNMTQISTDPIVGLSGLSQYKKYSDDLISSVGNLQKALSGN